MHSHLQHPMHAALPCREGAWAAAAARPLPPRAPQQQPASGGLHPPNHRAGHLAAGRQGGCVGSLAKALRCVPHGVPRGMLLLQAGAFALCDDVPVILALPLQEELDPGAVVAMGVPLSGEQPPNPPSPKTNCLVCCRSLACLTPTHNKSFSLSFYCSAVALLSPLWVVNATSLAIDAVIVPVEVPQTTAAKQGPGGAQRSRRQALEGLRCAPKQN